MAVWWLLSTVRAAGHFVQAGSQVKSRACPPKYLFRVLYLVSALAVFNIHIGICQNGGTTKIVGLRLGFLSIQAQTGTSKTHKTLRAHAQVPGESDASLFARWPGPISDPCLEWAEGAEGAAQDLGHAEMGCIFEGMPSGRFEGK